ncbi:MAG: SEC-C metal-binding domain-containing protein, partial [Kiritimatiellaeota bacterium]|nr:SEC-C metal-binding domain-containing protein [Kiritimatiellota bacterium]
QRLAGGPARVQTVPTDLNMLAGGVQTTSSEAPQRPIAADVPASAVQSFDAMLEAMNKPQQVSRAQPSATVKNVGRNDPCPCGSGKKYKKCCGQGL